MPLVTCARLNDFYQTADIRHRSVVYDESLAVNKEALAHVADKRIQNRLPAVGPGTWCRVCSGQYMPIGTSWDKKIVTKS